MKLTRANRFNREIFLKATNMQQNSHNPVNLVLLLLLLLFLLLLQVWVLYGNPPAFKGRLNLHNTYFKTRGVPQNTVSIPLYII